MNWMKLGTTYQIKIRREDQRKILQHDRKIRSGGAMTLGERLEKIPGVGSTDYVYEYGPYVFFAINAEKDTPACHRRIETVIAAYISEANASPTPTPKGKAS